MQGASQSAFAPYRIWLIMGHVIFRKTYGVKKKYGKAKRFKEKA